MSEEKSNGTFSNKLNAWSRIQKMETQVCMLWWYETKVQLNDDNSAENFESFLESIDNKDGGSDKGFVYCVEGMHDALRMSAPLYIGMSSHAKGLMDRFYGPKPSFGYFGYKDSANKMFLYSDIWDLVIRVASVAHSSKGADDVERVERHLIRFHKPSYNSKDITGYLTKPAENNIDSDEPISDNLVIINGGAKGTLLPVLASWYFAPSSWWPDDPERQGTKARSTSEIEGANKKGDDK